MMHDSRSPFDLKSKREPCPENEFTDWATGDMKSVDDWYGFIQRNRRDGETFLECENRLRRQA